VVVPKVMVLTAAMLLLVVMLTMEGVMAAMAVGA
jgi:hypothetical protein